MDAETVLNDWLKRLKTAIEVLNVPPSGDKLGDQKRYKKAGIKALSELRDGAQVFRHLTNKDDSKWALEKAGELGMFVLVDMHRRNIFFSKEELATIFLISEKSWAKNKKRVGKGPWGGLYAMMPIRLSKTALADAMYENMNRTIYQNKGTLDKVKTYMRCKVISLGDRWDLFGGLTGGSEQESLGDKAAD